MSEGYLNQLSSKAGEIRLNDPPSPRLLNMKCPDEDIRLRKGQFKISAHFLEYHPDIVQNILSQMVIWRAEYLGIGREVEYQATSSLFDPVDKDGDSLPIYAIKIVEGNVVATKIGLPYTQFVNPQEF